VLKSRLPDASVRVVLIDQPEYFDRSGLYQDGGEDYRDNCERFVFFSRAIIEAARVLDLRPDVIHANDWQTGLLPALLAIECERESEFDRTASVFTVHNMAFQGTFWHWDMLLTGLDWKYFNWKQMEFFDHLNLLKTGIVFADMVTTVSPTYAREIQTPEFGCGLEGVLHSRRDDLAGILNGVDIDVWNPQTDRHLAANYSAETFEFGKAACKAQLQAQLHLPQRGDVPLLGMISRMTDQKGFGLLAQCAESLLRKDIQLCFLGTGEAKYENWAKELAAVHPSRVSATIGFDDALAHRIEAGCDMFLMPSLFEPCGLNQMYSLIYGTIPIVRAVGGLADTVVDATPENQANGTANGFRFDEADGPALSGAMHRALALYQNKAAWTRLVRAAMRQDWSWSRSAREYLRVYERARSQQKRRTPAVVTV
jgi:starch synthase